ncbi:MAG: hypothetical protein IKO48_04575 [Elusimicrobia bacterium]|nr:hypothetical protein [Elusimicrobiota bacterium]
MFNKEIEEILKLTDEDLFHEKDYAKVSLIEKKADVEYLKKILTEISELNDIKTTGYQTIASRIDEVFRKIQNMFDIMKRYNGTNKNNIVSQVNSLISEIQSKYIDVLALISYEKSKKIDTKIKLIQLENLQTISDVEDKIDSKLEEIEKIKKQISKYELDAKKSLESIQDIANKVGVSKYSTIFNKQADVYNKAASKWFYGTIILLMVIIVCSFSLLFGWFNPPNDASWGIIVQFTTAKLIIFSALCIAISWTIKTYKANKHNEVLNKHRQNALDIFEAFVNGTSDEQTKNAVLLQAVQSIFAQQNTGYNDNETETGNAQTKILEFVSSSIKNSKQ